MTEYDGLERSSATEILRRGLDEHGVEYEAPHKGFTIVRTSNAVCKFYETLEEPERGVFAVVTTDWLTPEQAIAATLGATDARPTQAESSGTLTAEQVRDAVMSADRWKKPMGNTGLTNTHLIVRDDGWQAIADELNNTLGSFNCTNSERTETCHNISKVMDEHGQARFVCSECGAWIDSRLLWNPEYRNGESPWVKDCKLNFCPNCGAKVVDPTTNDVDAEVDA